MQFSRDDNANSCDIHHITRWEIAQQWKYIKIVQPTAAFDASKERSAPSNEKQVSLALD